MAKRQREDAPDITVTKLEVEEEKGLLPAHDQIFCETRDQATVYRVFYALEAANEYAATAFKRIVIPIFAADKPTPKNPGAKTFIVASYEMLWDQYVHTHPKARNLYETILEDVGCHMHIDAEYNRANNPHADEEWLDSTFKEECLELMRSMGYIQDKKKDVKIITLLSSNAKKVSRHYIIKMTGPKRYFKNNYHCGAFARRLRNALIDKYGPVKDNPFFLWGEKETDFDYKPGKSVKDCYMDMGIYTKRRQFRLYFSTKVAGDYRPLLLQSEHEQTQNYTKFDVLAKLTPKKSVLFDCFIQRIEPEWKEVQCNELDGSEPTSTSHKYTYRSDFGDVLIGRDNARAMRQIQSMNVSNGLNSVLATVALDNIGYHSPGFVRVSNSNNFGVNSNKLNSTNVPKICHRITPMIEEKVGGNGQVFMKGYSQIGDNLVVIFGTTSKVCELLGDKHGGNCVYYIASIMDKQYWQKCHSEKREVCRKRGKKHPFPAKYAKMVDDYIESIKSIYKQDSTIESLFELFDNNSRREVKGTE